MFFAAVVRKARKFLDEQTQKIDELRGWRDIRNSRVSGVLAKMAHSEISLFFTEVNNQPSLQRNDVHKIFSDG